VNWVMARNSLQSCASSLLKRVVAEHALIDRRWRCRSRSRPCSLPALARKRSDCRQRCGNSRTRVFDKQIYREN
jgi:hypothetical protein